MIKKILGFILLFPFIFNTTTFGFDPYQKDLDISKITCQDFVESLWPANDRGINGGGVWAGNAITTWLVAVKSKAFYSPGLLLGIEDQLVRKCSQYPDRLLIDAYALTVDPQALDDPESFSPSIKCNAALYFVSHSAITAYYREDTLSLAAIWYVAHTNPAQKFNLTNLKSLANTVLPACKANPSQLLFPLIKEKMAPYHP